MKFGQRLILLWPFGESNAAAMRAPDAATASHNCRATGASVRLDAHDAEIDHDR